MSKSADKGNNDEKKDEVRKTMIMPADMMEDVDEALEWEEVSPPTTPEPDTSGDRVNRSDKASFNQTLVDGKLPGGVEKPKIQRRRQSDESAPPPAQPPRRRPRPQRPPSPAPPGIRHRDERPEPQPRPRAAQPPQERVVVSLQPGAVRLDPGETEHIEIHLQNLGPVHGSFTIKVKCPTPDIRLELSQTLVAMDPGARATVGLTIHAPKSSSVTAGQHDLQVLVGSNHSRKRVGMAEGRITVTPYERYSVQVVPTKLKNNQTTQITIVNEGNAPVRYRISGRDQSAIIDFEIPEPVIEIEPGQSQTIPATLRTQSQILFGKEARHPFEVRVATTAGDKKSERGTLIVPPRISYLVAGIAGAVVILLLVALIATRGTPELNTEQANIICGNVRWLPNDVKNVVVPACRQLRQAEALGRDIDRASDQLGLNDGTTDGTTSDEVTTDGATGDGTNNTSGESELVLTAPTTDAGNAGTDDGNDSVTVVDTGEGQSTDNGASAVTVDWEVSSAELGTTSTGKPVATTQLGNGRSAILLLGGIHSGFAPSTVALPNQIIDHFTNNPAEIPDGVSLYVLPNFNPDSPPLVRDRSGRFNANGVDLNRNFDCDWTSNARVMGQNIPGSGGSSPLSEPESLALERWIVDVQPRAVIVLGAAAPSPEIAAGGCGSATQDSINLAETFAGASGFFVDNAGSVTGDVTDWLANRGIPSIFILLSDHNDPSLDYNSVLNGLRVVMDVYQ